MFIKNKSSLNFISKINKYIYTHNRSFFVNLLVSYLMILVICIFSMGILSYNFVSNNIEEESIKSNDRVLYQLKNTVDSLVLDKINDLSMIVLQDIMTDPSLSYYFYYDMNKNIYDMIKVMNYCEDLKSLNPMVFSVGIFYDKNDLYISTESAKSPQYGQMPKGRYFSYYKELVNKNNNNIFWSTTNDYEKKIGKEEPLLYNVIHMVRKVQPSGRASGSIILTVDEKNFYNSIKRTASETLDKILICDGNGTIVSNTDKEYIGKNISEFEYGNFILQSSNNSESKIINIDNIPCAVSFCSSDYNDWKYITVTPMKKINETMNVLLKTIVFVALLTILLGIIISLISSTHLSHPIVILAKFCGQLNKKHLSNYRNEYTYIRSTLEDLTLNVEDQKQKFEEVLPVIKDTFLQDLLSNQNNNIHEMEDRMRLIEFRFPFSRFCCLTIHINKKKDSNDILYDYEKSGVTSNLNEIFDYDSAMCLYSRKDDDIAVVINFDVDDKKFYSLVHDFLNKSIFELNVGIGPVVYSLCEISNSYLLATNSLKYRYIFPQKYIFNYDDILDLESSLISPDQTLISNLKNSFALQDEEKVIGDIALILSTLKSGEYSYEQVIETLSLCTSTVVDAAVKFGISLDNCFKDEDDLKTQFKKIESIVEYEQWVLCLVHYLFESISNLHSDINSEMVNKAKAYIDDNIKDNRLSLQVVAKTLYISPSHLSKIFKNETGITFIDYIINLKLEYCKDLLLNTSLKIEEISSVMGYSTPQYFISRFKLAYGFTPKEYRCKYAGKNTMI